MREKCQKLNLVLKLKTKKKKILTRSEKKNGNLFLIRSIKKWIKRNVNFIEQEYKKQKNNKTECKMKIKTKQ